MILAGMCCSIVTVVLMQAQASPDAAQQLAPACLCLLPAPLCSTPLTKPAREGKKSPTDTPRYKTVIGCCLTPIVSIAPQCQQDQHGTPHQGNNDSAATQGKISATQHMSASCLRIFAAQLPCDLQHKMSCRNSHAVTMTFVSSMHLANRPQLAYCASLKHAPLAACSRYH